MTVCPLTTSESSTAPINTLGTELSVGCNPFVNRLKSQESFQFAASSNTRLFVKANRHSKLISEPNMSKSFILTVFLFIASLAISTAFVPDELQTSTCTSGKRKGNACCLASCAFCGGPHCNTNMQGHSCCVTRIRASGRDCRYFPAPCVIPPSSPAPHPTTTATSTATPTSTASFVPQPADPFCYTGIKGTLNGFTVCCSRGCGKCGGSMCGKLPGGAQKCCKPAIISAGVSCSVSLPPCIVSPGSTRTPTPTSTPVITGADPTCSRGFIGVRKGKRVCCLRSCGKCGGMMCAKNPGGTRGCCIPRIIRDNVSCNVASAPCVLGAPPPTPTSTPFPTGSPDPTCINGIFGSRVDGDVCCAKSCGKCGGMMCANWPGGVANCCINKILDDGNSCATNPAPCVLRGPGVTPPRSPDPPTPSPITGDPTCSTGIRGVRKDGKAACCKSSCGTCGGGGCAERPGGVAACCIFYVFDEQPSCDVKMPPCSLGIVSV